ncbi:MAG: tRNA guanosine(34) transglycosylase Tgt [Planctomycetota bacterium]|jgi:queuine tRNA-ribosyltransferase|nr:tRNA guanosine(34) transglycosylase Tgt [Planctomycetota bacterium]
MADDIPTWQPGGGLQFRLLAQSGVARRGRFVSAHGVVETPAFMPVGTQGAVKTVQARDVVETGAQVVLANTYHMSWRDRVQLVERLGGLHGLMRWDQTILTDSGGFQVFSLPDREIDEEGVRFRFEQDGEQQTLSAESSMDLQRRLGADIVMAFDECVDHRAGRSYVSDSVERTFRWLQRCAQCELQEHQHLFGIVQGGLDLGLRTRSVELTNSLALPGTAIGGVSVGEGLDELKRVVAHTAPLLPVDKVRYLMGVGLPEDIVASVERGMDIFDCVIPTRYAREGTLFTWGGKMRIKDKKFRKDRYPIDTNCGCATCTQGYSRATLRYLLFISEPLAETLLTIHNLYFYQDLMRQIRQSIEEDRFEAWRLAFLKRYM